MGALRNRERVCMNCGNEFHLDAYAGKRKLCNACSYKKELSCSLCGNLFTFYGRTKALFCPTCRRRTRSESVMRRRAKKDPRVMLGVGSGGNQRGERNHTWNPNSAYRGVKRVDCVAARGICAVVWPEQCVICGDAGRLHAHHIDGNWRDCRVSNVIPLCVTCHKQVHKGACPTRTPLALVESLFSIWPEGRIKIAEKIGNPSTWESEVKARSNGWASCNDYLMKPETEYNSGTRPRDTQVSKDMLSLRATARCRG